MSVHSSLVVKSQLARSRSVWTRVERLKKLEEDGRRAGDEESVFGLPKVRTVFKVKSRKALKAEKKAEKEKAKDK